MTKLEIEMLKAVGAGERDTKPKPKQPEIISISREDFGLLDATADNTIYYITEPNGTVSVVKGDNR